MGATAAGRETRERRKSETRRSDMAQVAGVSADIMADENSGRREEIVAMLRKAYWMEIETVMSYLANSVNPDGVRAQEIKESLEEDITEELGHAKLFAQRIKDLYGVVPGSEGFSAGQSDGQPPGEQVEIVGVSGGVVQAEAGGGGQWARVVEATDQ